MSAQRAKMLVIGLDCATPRFVFGPEAFELPNLQSLMRQGCWGPLRSCDPPITVPAWACMMSGNDPGTLGIYGFRNRRGYDYEEMGTVDARDVRTPRLWDILSRHGKRVLLVGIPQTYPPRPVNGCMVSGLLTPGPEAPCTYPKALQRELLDRVGALCFDVPNYRTSAKAELLQGIYRLMDNRFDVAAYLAKSRPWDFFMMVEMGLDRLHHAFGRDCDPLHPNPAPDARYAHVFRDYYRRLDERIGELVAMAGDDAAVMVVSDHGAQPMHGGFYINQWLLDEGYLVLHESPREPMRLEDSRVDWRRTVAWSAGGYYARLFLNVAGREPHGIVPADRMDDTVAELKRRLEAMVGPDGNRLGTRALRPGDIYTSVNGTPPDLLVYVGDLQWRALGSVGTNSYFSASNDTGPDDANHHPDGIFIYANGSPGHGGPLPGLHLLDIAPTVLTHMKLPVPGDMVGRPIVP